FNLDEGAEVRQVTDASMNARADVITLVQSLPRVLLHLFHAETDAPGARVNAEHFDLNTVAGIDDLARMLDALGPAHFGNVDQTLDAVLELDEGAVIGHARDLSIHAAANRKTLLDTR